MVRRSRHGGHVAARAADTGKNLLARTDARGDRPTRWRREETHEVRHLLSVRAIFVRRRTGPPFPGNRPALRQVFVREERTGDTHLVQISVPCEKVERGVLRLPPEPAD